MYFTVLIPFEADLARRTQWHPTEATGPFSTLSRGAFGDEAQACGWATTHLGPDAIYTVERCE